MITSAVCPYLTCALTSSREEFCETAIWSEPSRAQLPHWIQIDTVRSKQAQYLVFPFVRIQDGLGSYREISKFFLRHQPKPASLSEKIQISPRWTKSQSPRCWVVHGICKQQRKQLGMAAFLFDLRLLHWPFSSTKPASDSHEPWICTHQQILDGLLCFLSP